MCSFGWLGNARSECTARPHPETRWAITDDVRALGELRERLRLAEETGDASLLEDVYAEDAVIMAPYSPTVEGRAACLEFARTLLASLASEFERQVDATSSELG